MPSRKTGKTTDRMMERELGDRAHAPDDPKARGRRSPPPPAERSGHVTGRNGASADSAADSDGAIGGWAGSCSLSLGAARLRTLNVL